MEYTQQEPLSLEKAEQIITTLDKKQLKKRIVEHQVAHVLANLLRQYQDIEQEKSKKLIRSLVHTCVKKNLDNPLCIMVYQSSRLNKEDQSNIEAIKKELLDYMIKKDMPERATLPQS